MISVKMDSSNLNARLARQQKALAQLPDEALKDFKSRTPIRSGNARSNTQLSSNRASIIGNYPYAQKLDDGYSKQAPRGMVGPFLTWFASQVKKIGKM